MSLGSALWFVGAALEIAVLVIALRKGLSRLLPIFFAYLVWTVISDGLLYGIKSNPLLYEQVYRYFEMPFDSLMQIGVLVELGWSVLRPMRSVLPRRTILLISLAILVVGTILWPLTAYTVNHSWPWNWVVLLRIQQTVSMLTVLFFLGLAALGQFLAISWRDRELQVATGLGFYSIVSLGAAILHTHPGSMRQFDVIENLVVLGYLFSLTYWCVSFLQQEAPRQEFSPRMQSILLTVAGAARANRLAMEQTRKNSLH